MRSTFSRARETVRHPLRARRRRTYRRHGFRRIGERGLALTNAALSSVDYQGLYGFDTDTHETRRNTDDRWDFIEGHLDGMGSALDIGCDNGWFVFKMAERGIVSIGADYRERPTRVSQWLTIANATDLAAFVNLGLTPRTIPRLPKTDVLLCLSVFHHWASAHGLEYATEMMSLLTSKCEKRLFFESGTPLESRRSWAKKLDFMQPEPLQWILSFLPTLGFSRVEMLGSTSGYQRQGERHVVMATR